MITNLTLLFQGYRKITVVNKAQGYLNVEGVQNFSVQCPVELDPGKFMTRSVTLGTRDCQTVRLCTCRHDMYLNRE